MKLTNQQIYTYALNLNDAFSDNTQKLPMKINFYLQKNKSTLIALAQEIEANRMDIIRTYGEPVDDGERFNISPDKIADAQKELNDLLNLEQEVTIYTISADSLTDDISLTTGQMEAILFMVI